MKQVYFLSPLQEHTVRKLSELYSGMEKLLVLYFNENDQEEEALSYFPKEQDLSTKIDVPEEWFQERKARNAYKWTHADFLEKDESVAKRSMTLFSESSNLVLMMRVENSADQLRDVYLLYFRQDGSNAGLAAEKPEFHTEWKRWLATSIQKFIQTEYEQYHNDSDAWAKINSQMHHMGKRISILQKENEDTRLNYEQMLANHCQQILSEICKDTGLKFMFSDAALQDLVKYKGNLKDYQLIIEEAAQVSLHTSVAGTLRLSIESWHLNFDIPKDQDEVQTEKSLFLSEKYASRIEYLDKLEKAAGLAKLKKQDIKSETVRVLLDKRVTAAAITDYLKNNAKSINIVMDQFPDKWPLIRSQFRPLINIRKAKAV